VNYGGAEGDFYYLTREARSTDLSDPEVRKQATISSEELTEAIKRIPALKQVMILDTCAAGKFVESLTTKRAIPSSQIRAMERLKDRTGLYVLAGCAADRASYEATRYAQGLVTYSLLLGMRGAALREDEYVDVASLFGYAADQVPVLAQDLGRVQRPIVAAPRGGASFDIGQLSSSDKEQIPLQPVRPLLLQSNFQDEIKFRDHLKLSQTVNARFRDFSSDGASAEWVYVDSLEFPGAFQLVGRYRVQEERVSVAVLLVHGDDVPVRFTIEGTHAQIDELADKIVEATRSRLREITKQLDHKKAGA
jgi:hypothetical protein